mgnify:FL=1
MPSFQDFYFQSSTGRTSIHALKCVPDGKPRAVVQIAHGIAEHIDRYRPFMEFLADNGFVAAGNDHLGHGKSIRVPEEQGFFAEKDGWWRVVDDMDKLHGIMSKEYPELPYVLFGHSMGSFLTRTYLIKHPDRYDAVILSGTGHQSPALVLGGNAAASVMAKLNGAMGDGAKLDSLAFGTYLSKIENPRTKFDWLSRDTEQVDKYIADPLCGFVGKIGLYRDMMQGIKFITSEKNIAQMNKEKPVYFMSGDSDPVGDYGKGVERAYKAFCNAGLHDVFMRLYPGGRHEMLNETNKEQVYQDILNWLNEKI